MPFSETIILPARKLLATNSTDSSITSGVPTLTEPTVGVIPKLTGSTSSNNVVLAFMGAGAADQVFTARIEGWKKGDEATPLWLPVPLLYLTCTLGTATGVAGGNMVASDYVVDTIVETTAYTWAYEIISPADNSMAWVKVDASGCDLVQVKFDNGTATNCNAVWYGF